MGGDQEGGAAKKGEAYQEGVGAVGVAADFTFEAAEVAADHADGVVDMEFGGLEAYGGVGLAEHKAEFLHLGVGDDCDGSPQPYGGGGAVDHKAVDVGERHEVSAFFFGAADEYHRGDDYAVDGLATAVFPQSHLFLGGYIAFHADFPKLIPYRFLVARVHDGHEPFGSGHAYGTVSAHRLCRAGGIGKFCICSHRQDWLFSMRGEWLVPSLISAVKLANFFE